MTDLLGQWREHRKLCDREDDSERLGDLMAAEIASLKDDLMAAQADAQASKSRLIRIFNIADEVRS